jgi:hypothetical protein
MAIINYPLVVPVFPGDRVTIQETGETAEILSIAHIKVKYLVKKEDGSEIVVDAYEIKKVDKE